MPVIEGIGDDLLHALGFLLFSGMISLIWVSTRVNYLHETLWIIERQTRRRNDEESHGVSPVLSLNVDEQIPRSPSTANEIFTEHESDIESSEIEEFPSEQSLISPEPTIRQRSSSHAASSEEEEEDDQSLRITIKFLDETQKSISANANDTISKIKRLYFTDELSANKIIRFIYQGRELQDCQTLRTSNIRDQTIIHCQISTRRHSTPHRMNERLANTQINPNGFETSSFLDVSPIHIPPHALLFLTFILGSIWYLRIKYRLLFTPISTIILILITILFLLFACGSLFSRNRTISSTTFE